MPREAKVASRAVGGEHGLAAHGAGMHQLTIVTDSEGRCHQAGLSDALVVSRRTLLPLVSATYTASNPSRPEMNARRVPSRDQLNEPSYPGDEARRVRRPSPT